MAIEQEILKSYIHASHEVNRRFREHYGKINLTFPQAMVISLLDGDEPLPISAIAEATGSANSTISGIVDRLERMELVRRRRSDEDRRVIYVEATDRCRALAEETVTTVADCFAELLAPLTEEEKESVLKGFNLLAGCLEEEKEEE